MSNLKAGLGYFSFDVDFFEDPKLEFISAKFGIKGEIIAIKLLCRIYRNGYYMEWNDDQAILFAKRVGDGVAYSLVKDVVSELVRRGFFSETILNSFGVLTSSGIQKRYFEAVKRRKSIAVNRDYLLVSPECMQDVNIISQNVNIIKENADSLRQSKVKESKESKGKENNNTRVRKKNDDDDDDDFVFPLFHEFFGRKPVDHDSKTTRELVTEFGIDLTRQAFKKARETIGEKISLAYIRKILENHKNGVQKQHADNKANGSSTGTSSSGRNTFPGTGKRLGYRNADYWNSSATPAKPDNKSA